LGPLGRGRGQLAVLPQVVPTIIQPQAKPLPFPQKRFMGHFCRRPASCRVTIQGQQTNPAEFVENAGNELSAGGGDSF
jgi:hypothetical protein